MKLVELSNLLNNTIISFIYAQIPTKKRQHYAIDINSKIRAHTGTPRVNTTNIISYILPRKKVFKNEFKIKKGLHRSLIKNFTKKKLGGGYT